jgi:hypothetical protein
MESKVKNKIPVSNVAILLIGYNRPEFLRRRISEISESKLENLLISIDGGVKSKTTEMEETKKFAQRKFSNLKYFEITHHENNLGLGKHLSDSISLVLGKFEYIIVIEDDIKISNRFISNMINGLTLQQELGISGIVSGFSPLYLKHFANRWRVSIYPYVWGWACSRELWLKYQHNLSGINLEDQLNSSKTWNNFSSEQKNKWLNLFRKAQADPFDTWAIQLSFWSFCNDFKNLTPIFSLVGNEGFNDVRSVHTKGKKPKFVTINKMNNNIVTRKNFIIGFWCKFIDKYWMGDVRI